jgi:hypothetical protein
MKICLVLLAVLIGIAVYSNVKPAQTVSHGNLAKVLNQARRAADGGK